MSDYTKVGEGTMNKNDKAQGKQPSYRGKIEVTETIPAGSVIYLGAWVKEGKYGKYFSIQAQVKADDVKQAPPPDAPFDDDIPF